MFVFLFVCIYTNPATGCYMNKTILCVWARCVTVNEELKTDTYYQHLIAADSMCLSIYASSMLLGLYVSDVQVVHKLAALVTLT